MFCKKFLVSVLTASFVLSVSTFMINAKADETNANAGENAQVNTSVSGRPSSVLPADIPDDLNLDEAVQNAGLLELGENNIPPDPILNSTPWVHYRFTNTAGTPIAMTESINNTYLYDRNGFSRLFLSHNSKTPTDRYYLRVYTKKQGWLPWTNSNYSTPNPDDNDKIQALQIRMKGYVSKRADIYYKAVLNDGTVLGWAKNGQTLGSIGSDRYIVALKISLWNKDIPFPASTSLLTQSEYYDGMYFDENGNVSYSTADGSPYTGWVYTNDDQYYFKDGVKLTSWQYIGGYKYFFGEDGKLDKDLEDNMGLTGDYLIKYNKATRTMYVMARDGANGYIIPYKTFNTSSGADTPIGTFRTYEKYRWKFMHDGIYCQFLTRFNGPFLIHSILYEHKPTSYHLDSATYNGLEVAQSSGCIRLLSGDAAWIYHNVPLKTTVTIYSDLWDKGPVEKPSVELPIPREQNFDPTDPAIIAKQQAEDAEAARKAAEEAMRAEANGDAGETKY